MNQEELLRYKTLITSFVNTAIMQTDGVSKQQNIKGKIGAYASGRNVQVYFYNDEVTVDLFISVIYGFRVPDVVCALQEKVIALIKKNTHFKVKNINVNVANVIFM